MRWNRSYAYFALAFALVGIRCIGWFGHHLVFPTRIEPRQGFIGTAALFSA
jgi:hypothetical protein